MATVEEWNEFYKQNGIQELAVMGLKNPRLRKKFYNRWKLYCRARNIDEKFSFFDYDNATVKND